MDAAPAAHTAQGERSQALNAASDLRHRHQMLSPKKGELSRYYESQGKSRSERWHKEQEIVQGTVAEISGDATQASVKFPFI